MQFKSKIAIIPPILTEKHVKYLEVRLETIIWGNSLVKIVDFVNNKYKIDQKFVKDSNFDLELLTV